jgi:predicted amidohydrolase
MALVTVAAATLPSIPLDFLGNKERILESIRIAKDKGATLRTGPELEIPGYCALDHHLEGRSTSPETHVAGISLIDWSTNHIWSPGNRRHLFALLGGACRHYLG